MNVKTVRKKIRERHGDLIDIDETTYIRVTKRARLIDKEFGEFWTSPSHVIYRGDGHPARKQTKREQTNLKKYGVKCTLQHPEVSEKARKTFNEKYGCDYSAQSKEIRSKMEETNVERYGVRCVFESEEIKIKAEQTNLERYGVKNPAQNKEIYQKIEETNIEKYGVRNPQQNLAVRKKTEETNYERYGTKAPAQNLEIYHKCIRSITRKTIKTHWRTGEEIICTASYEDKIVDFFNQHKIDYIWQRCRFYMEDGRYYLPDCYLPEFNIWVEIKGYFWKDAKEKWQWFSDKYENAELWNVLKLKSLGLLE